MILVTTNYNGRTIYISYIVYWCNTLFYIEPVVSASITISGETLCKVLYQHTMYVINLSNISIKKTCKQITRVELKLTYLYNDFERKIAKTTLSSIVYVIHEWI
jgi:hypothetical protein